MSSIAIHTDRKFSATAVPNLFIDRYMPDASGSYVKVYLYLLRCISGVDTSFSLALAAEQLDETEKDIMRALSYWEKVHVLSLTKEKNVLTSIRFLDLSSEPLPENNSNTPPEGQNVYGTVLSLREQEQPLSSAALAYSDKQIEELCKNEDISWLMDVIEVYLERLLTPQDINLVLFLYDKLHFSKELILHLYEYCISKNKKKCEYIEKVALSWHEEGIDTVEKAEQVSILYDSCFTAVNRAFSLGRLPGKKERDYIRRWSSYGLPTELIEEACNRTIMAIHKPDFKYADKIIKSWHTEGISTLDAVAQADLLHAEATQLLRGTYSGQTVRNAAGQPSYATASEQSGQASCNAAGQAAGPAAAGRGTASRISGSSASSAAPVSKSAGAYNSYPQRQYSAEELLELERQLLSQQ